MVCTEQGVRGPVAGNRRARKGHEMREKRDRLEKIFEIIVD